MKAKADRAKVEMTQRIAFVPTHQAASVLRPGYDAGRAILVTESAATAEGERRSGPTCRRTPAGVSASDEAPKSIKSDWPAPVTLSCAKLIGVCHEAGRAAIRSIDRPRDACSHQFGVSLRSRGPCAWCVMLASAEGEVCKSPGEAESCHGEVGGSVEAARPPSGDAATWPGPCAWPRSRRPRRQSPRPLVVRSAAVRRWPPQARRAGTPRPSPSRISSCPDPHFYSVTIGCERNCC